MVAIGALYISGALSSLLSSWWWLTTATKADREAGS
jgi:hypothetical protein